MIENIKTKLKTGNYSLSKSDLEIIKSNTELSEIVLELFLNNPSFYNDLNINLLGHFLYGEGSSLYNKLDKEVAKTIGFNLINYFLSLKYFIYSYEDLDLIYHSFAFDKKDKEKGAQLIENYYKNTDRKDFLFDCSYLSDVEKAYDFFLEIGRPDLVKYLGLYKVDLELTEELQDKLDKYNFAKYGVPQFVLYATNVEKYYDSFTLKELCTRRNNPKLLLSDKYTINDKKLNSLIIQKIHSIDSFIGEDLSYIQNDIPGSIKLETYNKDSFRYIDYLLRKKVITIDDVISKLKLITKNYEILNSNYFPQDSLIYKDKELKELMISKGYIRPLVNCNSLDDTNIDRVIEILNSKEYPYNSVINNINEIVKDNIMDIPPKLLEYLIDNNYINSDINVSSINNEELLIKLLDKNPNINISFSPIFLDNISDELLNCLFNNKRYDLILKCFYSCNYKLVLDTIIQKDLYSFAQEIISKLDDDMLKELLNNEKILNYYLNNEYLCKNLFDSLINDEINATFIDRNIFSKFENHIISYYDLNKKHVDYLVDNFGIGIIKYLNNDKFKDFVNSSDEEFTKIMKLFSDREEFDTEDFLGMYLGLLDKVFVKRYPEKLTIVTEIEDKLDKKDYQGVERLLLLLRIDVTEDIFKEIKNEYNLNCSNIDELFKYVYNGLLDEEMVVNTKNILHDINKLYLQEERRLFLYNHYFDSLYNYNEMYQLFLKYVRSDTLYEMYDLTEELYNMYRLSMNDKNLRNRIDILRKDALLDQFSRDDIINYSEVFKEVYNFYRNNYEKTNKNPLITEFNLPYTFVEAKVNKEIINDILVNIDKYYINNTSIRKILIGEVNKDSKDFSDEDLTSVIYLLKHRNSDDSKNFSKKDIGIVKSKLKLLVDKASEEEMLNYNRSSYEKILIPYDRDNHINRLDKKNQLERVPYFNSIVDIYGVLSNINMNLTKENILNNEDNYNSLKKIIKNKKLFSIPDGFTNMLEESNLSSDYSNLAYLFNYYEAIIDRERKKAIRNKKEFNISSISIVDILSETDLFSSSSSIYNIILGLEDARLIIENSGPNAVLINSSKERRLKKAVEYTVSNYLRRKVTVPTFDKEFERNGKKLRAICGNFTSPCNITHGERTGSCMRIDGIGNSLFDFCLRNNNGFHIRFENPENNEYVGRVSGFRNGNTVFLNQLRHSVSSDYTDEDLCKILKEVARELIEQSKNSSRPIDNVVIDNSIAFTSSKDVVKLNIESVKEGLPNFYTNVGDGGKAILLASSDNDKLVPINLSKEGIPSYEVNRSKTIYSEDEKKLLAGIQRVDSIKQLISDPNVEKIKIKEIEEPLLFGFINDDYYVCADESGNIVGDFLRIDSRIEKDYQRDLEIIKKKIEERKKEKSYGNK